MAGLCAGYNVLSVTRLFGGDVILYGLAGCISGKLKFSIVMTVDTEPHQ